MDDALILVEYFRGSPKESTAFQLLGCVVRVLLSLQNAGSAGHADSAADGGCWVRHVGTWASGRPQATSWRRQAEFAGLLGGSEPSGE